MKTIIAAAALAATTAVATLPTPASAIGVFIGPRGGVGIGLGGPRFRRFAGPRFYAGRAAFVRPGWGWRGGWRRGWRAY